MEMGFCTCNWLSSERSQWSRVDAHPTTGALTGRGNRQGEKILRGQSQRQEGGAHVPREARMAGATSSCEGQEGAPPRGARGSHTWPLGLQTARRCTSALCSHRVWGHLLQQPQEANLSSCVAFSLPLHRPRPLSLTSWSRTEHHRLRGPSHPARWPSTPLLGQHQPRFPLQPGPLSDLHRPTGHLFMRGLRAASNGTCPPMTASPSHLLLSSPSRKPPLPSAQAQISESAWPLLFLMHHF